MHIEACNYTICFSNLYKIMLKKNIYSYSSRSLKLNTITHPIAKPHPENRHRMPCTLSKYQNISTYTLNKIESYNWSANVQPSCTSVWLDLDMVTWHGALAGVQGRQVLLCNFVGKSRKKKRSRLRNQRCDVEIQTEETTFDGEGRMVAKLLPKSFSQYLVMSCQRNPLRQPVFLCHSTPNPRIYV